MGHANVVMKTRIRTVLAKVHKPKVVYSRMTSRKPIVPVIYVRIRLKGCEPAKNLGTEYGGFRR